MAADTTNTVSNATALNSGGDSTYSMALVGNNHHIMSSTTNLNAIESLSVDNFLTLEQLLKTLAELKELAGNSNIESGTSTGQTPPPSINEISRPASTPLRMAPS